MKAERIADRDDQLADPQPARIAEPDEDRCLAFEPQHREIGVGVVTDQNRAEAAPVGKGRLDLAGAADDVAVGQHIGVGGEHDTGACAVDAFIRSGNLQVKDCRAHSVDRADDGARIGVEKSEILGRGANSPAPERRARCR